MIRTRALSKSYGDLTALGGIDLDVQAGDIYGFIGPNGAGKTTTLRILATLMEPSGGDAWVQDVSVWDDKPAVRRLIGWMPDSFGVYPDLSVSEYLHFFAAAYGIPRRERGGLVDGLLELTDLGYKREALVEGLSKGMKQRLGLARALVHDPKVLLLDEPAAGLDPRARVDLREILRELRRMGKTILLSSHILSELAEVCNRFGILERGTLVAQGTLAELAGEEGGPVVELRTSDDAAALAALRGSARVVTAVRDEEDPLLLQVTLAPGEPLEAVAEILFSAGVLPRHIARRATTLEAAFLRLTRGLVQ